MIKYPPGIENAGLNLLANQELLVPGCASVLSIDLTPELGETNRCDVTKKEMSRRSEVYFCCDGCYEV